MSEKVNQLDKERRVYYGGMLLFLLTVVVFALPRDMFVQVGVVGTAAILFIIFLVNIEWGLYAVAATSFFYGWDIVLSQYSWTKNIYYLSSLNAPVVDFIAAVLVGGVVVMALSKKKTFDMAALKRVRPLLILYGLFCAVGAYAAMHAYGNAVGASLKYLVRSVVFVCVAYVVVPQLMIQDGKTLLRVLRIWFWVGVGVALFGLSSLVAVPQTGFWHVIPYQVGQFAPLGNNHNLIAQALVALVPVSLYLAWHSYQHWSKLWRWYLGATFGMVVVELLTLSRAGWVATLIQAALLAWLAREKLVTLWKRHIPVWGAPLTVVAGVLLLYMAVFLRSAVVTSSNTTRLELTSITAFYTARSPWVGYGPGMFIPILTDTQDYVQDFGDPLDAHGFIQKVLVEEGFLGLILFGSFLLYALGYMYMAQKKASPNSAFLLQILLVAVVGELVFQLFDTSYFTSVIWLPLGVALVAASKVHNLSYEH